MSKAAISRVGGASAQPTTKSVGFTSFHPPYIAHRTLTITALVVLGVLSAPLAAQPAIPKSIDTSGREYITPATQRSIDRGLAFLSLRQHEDGSFGSGTMYPQNVAVTSLCGMAFLAAGHTPGRGRYGETVSKSLDFILSRCEPSGLIVDHSSKSHGPMYGHGFATMFLAEAYGMSQRDDLREKLENAIRLIINTQNDEGGWRYYPVPSEADISVTVCQMMALRAARNAGIYVPKSTVDACVQYVKKCQNSDGGFRYQLIRQAESMFPRSAAGVVALYSAGIYEGQEIQRGLDYLSRFVPGTQFFRDENHYFYGHYYAVQAMWHAGGAHWHRWFPAIRDEMLDQQESTGGWPAKSICTEYSTAMACLVLQMPNNYLPIFQR